MKNRKVKIIIYFLCIVFLLSFTIHIAKAHVSLLDVEYDSCVKRKEIDGIDETWYYLNEKEYRTGPTYTYSHFDDSINTIKYYISNNGKDDPSYEWDSNVPTSIANEIKAGFVQSMLKWNDIYFYKYDNYGNVTSNRLINIIEGTSSDHNLVIYPLFDTRDNSNYAQTNYSQPLSTTSNSGNNHYLNWYMEVNIEKILSTFDYTNENFGDTIIGKRTGQHEMGHVLGLDDIDVCCNGGTYETEKCHHEEVLMGYGNTAKRATYATYKDIAGVAIARGLHSDMDHVWMKRVNSDDSIDMICSICNGVRYDVNLDNDNFTYQGKTFTNYKDCIHNGGGNSENIKVASDGERDFFKCLGCRHIDTIKIKSEFRMGNYSQNLQFNFVLDKNTNIYCKIQSEYAKYYEFDIYGIGRLNVRIFDKNFNEIELNDYKYEESQFRTTCYMENATYYIKIENLSSANNIIDLDVYSRKSVYLSENIDYDILINSYNNIKDYYLVNGNGPGFFAIKIDCLNTNGTLINNENAIAIYNNSNKCPNSLIKKINSDECEEYAKNKQNELNFIFCLESNGVYYLDIDISCANLKVLMVRIERITSTSYNLFNLDENVNEELCTISSFYIGDYATSVNFEESGKFDIDAYYCGELNRNFILFVASKRFNSIENCFKIETIFFSYMSSSINSIHISLIMEKGTYYVGYLGKRDGEDVEVTFTRCISQSGSSVILVDPGESWLCGSQINIVEMHKSNKSYNSNIITKGFTRIAYLDGNYVEYDSRLDYEWYSSNESIIFVTSYGTIFGCGTGNAKIMAVLKIDPSIVFVKEFFVYEDEDSGLIVVENSYYVSFDETENGIFHLELENINCPFPMYQYYTWETNSMYASSFINNDMWGNYTIDGICSFDLIGSNYIYNTRYITIIVIIHVFII